MPKTIFDLIAANNGSSILLVHRHASYLTGPVAGRYPTTNAVMAANYSEKEPPCLFLLDEAGIQRSRAQGRQLAEAGVVVEGIVASHQGRGPDTAMRISEGHFQATGKWIPVSCDPRVDYPRYNLEPVQKCLDTIGDPFVAQWLNGQHPNLVRSDTPLSFQDRTLDVIDQLMEKPGVRIMSCHFENVTLVHGLFVHQGTCGTMPEDWFPTKSGGVVIVQPQRGVATAYDYNPDLSIVE